MKKFLIGLFPLFILSCSNPTINSTNPTERGLGYVAAAILTSALLRTFFND